MRNTEVTVWDVMSCVLREMGDLFVFRVQSYCGPLVMETAVPPKSARLHIPEERKLCRNCTKYVIARDCNGSCRGLVRGCGLDALGSGLLR